MKILQFRATEREHARATMMKRNEAGNSNSQIFINGRWPTLQSLYSYYRDSLSRTMC